MNNAEHSTIDLETRSVADLRKVGPWVYSEHPSTGIICMKYRLPHFKAGRTKLWHPAYPSIGLKATDMPEDLFDHITGGGLVEAHNAFFERSHWLNILMPQYEFPKIKHRQWRCSAAKAAAMGLPRALEDACKVLKLPFQKDMEGNKIMMKCSKPKKLRKEERKFLIDLGEDPDSMIHWHEDRKDFERTFEYCGGDVLAEEALSAEIPDLNNEELEHWLHNQEINQRGIFCDRDMVMKAQALATQETANLNRKLFDITGIAKATQRKPIKAWLAENGVDLPNMQGRTLELELRKKELPKLPRKVLNIVRSVNKTSIAKYKAMELRMSIRDDRIRDILRYGGAHTLRDCMLGSAEVLTREGWVRFDKWTGGEIAQWSWDHSVSFRDASVVSFQVSEDLVSLENKNYKTLYTEEHRIPVHHKRNGRVFDVAAKDIKKHSYWETYTAGCLLNDDRWEDEMITRAMVMFQADGHIAAKAKSPGTRPVLKISFKKKRKIERCRWILKSLGIKFSESGGRKHHPDYTFFYIAADDAPRYLLDSKKFGPYLLKHSPHVFTEEVRHWDGTWDKRNTEEGSGTSYSTCSKVNAEWVQTMAHLAGTTATIFMNPRQEENWNTSYQVYIQGPGKGGRIGFRSVRRGWKFGRKHFKGKVYCAKTQTGYFLARHNGHIFVTGNSGQGVQLQNMVSNKDIQDMMALCNDIKFEEIDWIRILHGDAMMALSQAGRGAFMASKGKRLTAGDFAAIEARGIFWLAKCNTALAIFLRGDDIYCDFASTIYRRKITKDDKRERGFGKVAILGLGFSMGFCKFLLTLRKFDIVFTREECRAIVGRDYNDLVRWIKGKGKKQVKMAEDLDIVRDLPELVLSKYVVDLYRETYSEIPQFWKDLENAAIAAMESPGRRYHVGHISFRFKGRFLRMRLPSGRDMSYFQPRVSNIKTKWGQVKKTLSYMGTDSTSTGGKRWGRVFTYGGKIAENATQACARDVMKEAEQRIKKHGLFKVVLCVHDEIVGEHPENEGDAKEFEQLMSVPPKWASGFPIAVEASTFVRYHK